MIKKLAAYVGEFKREALLSPICIAIEVIMEVILPLLMASVIDKGVNAGDMNYVVKMGLLMIVVAFVSLAGGALCGKYAAVASSGFARNLRRSMFAKIQDFSFANIDKFSTAGLVTRMTTDVIFSTGNSTTMEANCSSSFAHSQLKYLKPSLITTLALSLS